jgi:hypothetical protein
MDLREIGWASVDWIQLAQDRDRWRAVVNTVMNLRVLAPRNSLVLPSHLCLGVRAMSSVQASQPTFCVHYHCHTGRLGDVVVSVLTTGPKV